MLKKEIHLANSPKTRLEYMYACQCRSSPSPVAAASAAAPTAAATTARNNVYMYFIAILLVSFFGLHVCSIE